MVPRVARDPYYDLLSKALRADVTRVEGFIQDYALPSRYRRAIVVGKHRHGPAPSPRPDPEPNPSPNPSPNPKP